MREARGSKAVGLLALAVTIAAQVPTSLGSIEPPVLRVVTQLCALVVVVGLAVFVSPREVRRTVERWSGRPPPPR
jgi:hypothetical protein